MFLKQIWIYDSTDEAPVVCEIYLQDTIIINGFMVFLLVTMTVKNIQETITSQNQDIEVPTRG